MNVQYRGGRWPLAMAAVTLSLLGTLGCGSGDSGRQHATGKVTYQGQPVKHGTIMFEPDTRKGNSGPAGSASIVDGVYDTRRDGVGISSGPQWVTIQAFSGQNVNPEYAPYGTVIGDGETYAKSFEFSSSGLIEQDFELTDVIGKGKTN